MGEILTHKLAESLSAEDLDAAPMFTVFREFKGQCKVHPDATPEWYSEFSSDEGGPDDGVFAFAEALQIHVSFEFIERVDDVAAELDTKDEFDDTDAALCYLNAGGTLVKIPDAFDSEFYRFYVCEIGVTHVQAQD